jgi:hypothetical protein
MKSERLAQRLLLTARGDDAGRRSDDDNRDASNGLIFGPEGGSQFFHAGHPVGACEIRPRPSGKVLSSFGRPGHQIGEFTHGHTFAVDSKATFM